MATRQHSHMTTESCFPAAEARPSPERHPESHHSVSKEGGPHCNYTPVPLLFSFRPAKRVTPPRCRLGSSPSLTVYHSRGSFPLGSNILSSGTALRILSRSSLHWVPSARRAERLLCVHATTESLQRILACCCIAVPLECDMPSDILREFPSKGRRPRSSSRSGCVRITSRLV